MTGRGRGRPRDREEPAKPGGARRAVLEDEDSSSTATPAAVLANSPAPQNDSNNNNNNNNTNTTPAIQDQAPPVGLVTVHVFIYFLCDLKHPPFLVIVQGDNVVVNNQNHGHVLWVELRAPANKEIRFRLQCGSVSENYWSWNDRKIEAEYMYDGMVYLDFNNMMFNSTYGNHATLDVNSVTPYFEVATFLATKLATAKFEQELEFMFGKVHEKARRRIFNMDANRVFDTLSQLAERGLIANEEVFIKGVIICGACPKRDIQVYSKFFSLEIIKNARRGLELAPQYIEKASRLDLHGHGRDVKGMFLLIAAFSTARTDNRRAQQYLHEFKSHAAKLNEDEIQLLSSVDWHQYPTLSAVQFCGCLAAAAQINQVEAVLPYLLSNGRREYVDTLNNMTYDSYLVEWKYCILLSPPVAQDKIPFSLAGGKFRNEEQNERQQVEIEGLIEKLVHAKPTPQRLVWAKHLRDELLARAKRQCQNTPQRYVSTLLGIINKVAEDESLLRIFHDMMPNVADTSITPRTKELLKCTNARLIELERQAILRLVDTMSRDFLDNYHNILLKQFGDEQHGQEVLMQIYELCWSRLINILIKELTFSMTKQGHILKAIGTNTRDSDLFYYLTSSDINKCFDTAYEVQAVPTRMEALLHDAEALEQNINNKEILPEVVPILAEPGILDRLQTILARDVQFTSLQRHYNNLRDQWTSFLESFNIMKACEQFATEATAESAYYREEYKKMETSTLLSMWAAPNCHPHFRIVSGRLTKLKDSLFFQHIWNDLHLRQRLTTSTGKGLTERWVEYFELHFEHWRELVVQIGNGHAPISTIEDIFSRTIQMLGPQFRGKLQHSTEAEVRQRMETLRRNTKKEIEQLVESEVDVYISLTNAQLEKAVVFTKLHSCVTALVISDDIVALAELTNQANIATGSPAINNFCNLCKDASKWSQTPYHMLVQQYDELVSTYAQVTNIISGFPALFLKVFFEHDLLKVLSLFSDVIALNTRIDSRQAEDLREDTHDILHALRLLCDSQSVLVHPIYAKMRIKATVTFQELLDFFVACGSAVVALAILQDKMKKGGNQVVMESLQSDSEERQTITIVKNLLVRGGKFNVEAKNGVISTTATYIDPTRQQSVTIAPEELEALPSQLLLTSGVTTKNQASYDVDAPLPENIARLEDRECYVLKFNALFDMAFQLSEVVKRLCHSGHPDYQERTISFECHMYMAELTDYVRTLEQLLLKWTNTFAAFRESCPILMFLSRSQLVSCLTALRTQNLDLLFSTLQSIGCNPSTMSQHLQSNLSKAKNVNSAGGLFEVLTTCLQGYFDVEKLEKIQTGAADLQDVQSPLRALSSLYKLVRIGADDNLEEVICGAHIALHKRTPCPIEILFCSSHTTGIDVEDFLDRWAMFSRIAQSTHVAASSVTFWLVKVEELAYPIQSSCMQKLPKLAENLPPTHPKLFLVTWGSQKTYISHVLIKDEVELKHEMCIALSSLIQPIAASFNNIYVVHSKYCGEGKTTSVIQSLVCDRKDSTGQPALHAQFSLDTTPMDVVLRRLLAVRPMTSEQGLILHFNVGHQADVREVNLFLFQYLFISSWRDKHGFTFPRHEKDTIVIELCNTGKEDERNRIKITKYFQQLPLCTGISYAKMTPIPSPTCNLFYSFIPDHAQLELGTQMLIANFNAMKKGTRVLPYKQEVRAVELVDTDELYNIMVAISCDNWCPQRHLMLTLNTPAHGDVKCGRCQSICSPADGYASCATCSAGLCHRCMKKIPVPRASELLFLRRFFQFIVTQLQNFFDAFTMWEFVCEEDGDIYQKLAYHYCRMIISCSQNLAKPAMEHYDEKKPLDDVQRCRFMDKFENWRDTPFFLVTPHNFHVTSTSTFSPFQFIKDNEPNNAHIQEWLQLAESLLQPVNRNQLQQITSQLSETAYSVDQVNPPLKTLLEVLGCHSGAMSILNAIEITRKHGTKTIDEMGSSVDSAVGFLLSIGKLTSTNITCTEFMNISTRYLCSLFGANASEKPAYTLTADNILRIMALQMRLISGIPVCIMGETGCGKTETLHFLANISGSDFRVINVQEGMMEREFYQMMQPHIQHAEDNPLRQVVILLDEVNATSALWTAKDMLCDHICFGVRIPSNIVFVVILNPWKERTAKQQLAIAEMDVGGLDFLKYQQNASKDSATTQAQSLNLVYQVHRSPETLYSLVWDWGSSSTTETPLQEIRRTIEDKIVVKNHDSITDEMLMASSMVSWLINKLKGVVGLRNDFKNSGDGTEGEIFWKTFRTLLVEMLLASQQFLRHDVYLDELSVVSLRDIRKACELIGLVFIEFWEVRAQLQKHHLTGAYPYFRFLTNSVHVALVNTYCLRLDSERRLTYLVRIQKHWSIVRGWFTDITQEFMPSPSSSCPSYNECELYKSFNELATYIVSGLDVDTGIAVNQALTENTFAVLCAVCTKSPLFIVGRPGSTKSRTLELLIRATEYTRPNTFLGGLRIVIQKHVVQCSPYTTAHHVHSNARRAAMAQIAADKIVNSRVKRINAIVLEEVGATIGSAHNPLMSLHSMIDYGIEIDGKYIRLPIIGVSNYRLDASKMGRGRVVYRGNPPLNDLELTARAILRGLGEATGGKWIENFSLAFSENILRNEKFTWYYGMRDFYATVSTICILATPLDKYLNISQLARTSRSEINSHITRWAVLINLRGFPDKKEERILVDAMQRSFGLDDKVLASWTWKTNDDADSIRLCDCCCNIQLYRESLVWKSRNPDKELNDSVLTTLFKRYATPIMHQSYCQCFDNEHEALPAAEVISYSLREITCRHVMVFTKANAALLLLFSMGLVRKEECTVIFQSTNSSDKATTASELVQQMMRIKACMREGKTLILVKSRHLYESMLDALNVHYTKDRSSNESDNLHKTMLSMSGVTQHVFVQPTFRCIVLEDQDELESSVLPPMINRFSKTILTYSSALNAAQVNTRGRILEKSLVEISTNQKVNLLQFLIPGLSEESLDSSIYSFSDFDEVVFRLCHCFSRKNLRRLSLMLVEGLNTKAAALVTAHWSLKWRLNKCSNSFETLAQNTLSANGDNAGKQHLMAITEQLQINASSLAQTLDKVFVAHDQTTRAVLVPNQITILNQATSGDVYAVLAALKRTPAQDDLSVMSVFVLDTTSATQSVHLDSFMYAVSSEISNKHHHAVLVVVVSDVAAASSQRHNPFSLVFDSSWGQVFADEIVPLTLGGALLPSSMLDALEKDVLLHEVLQPELIFALVLEKDNLTTLCQSLSTSASGVRHNMQTIKQLFSFDTPLRKCIVDVLRENTRLAEVPFERWSKIAFQRAKFSSDSLRAIYLSYLGGYVIRVLIQLLGVLMHFNSIELSEDVAMMEIIANLVASTDIVPRCDIEGCLTLAPLSFAKTNDVESKNGFFLFPKMSRIMQGELSKVTFPLSPFIATHVFNMGFDVEAINTFLNSVKLTATGLDNAYFHDALCIGANISPARLPLLKKIVRVFYPNSFSSISAFHCLIAEHTDWFKYVMAFSMTEFSEESIADFPGQTVNDLMQLAAIDGVVPLTRVEVLCAITRNDRAIDWRLVRAMAMIDSIKHEDAPKLVAIHNQFCIGEVEGIDSLLRDAPYNFIKYFFFELFAGNQGAKEEVVSAILTNLSKRTDLNDLLSKHEDFQCGIAFLLRKALAIIFQQEDPQTGMLFKALTEFILAGVPHFILTSHCVFDAIYSNDIIAVLNDKFMGKFANGTPLCHLIRIGLVVYILTEMIEMTEDDAVTQHNTVVQLLQGNIDDIKHVTLFVLRRLSSGGTVDLDKAVVETRKAKFPPVISGCELIDLVSRALQKVSPLACMPEFVLAVAALSEYAIDKTNNNLARFAQLNAHGVLACIAAHCASVAPQPIPNFNTDIYPTVVGQFPQAVPILQQFLNNAQLRAKPEKLRELVLCLVLSIINDNKAAVFYKQTVEAILLEKVQLRVHRLAIEDMMNPKCPRCRAVFYDWSGCFSVYCNCGCSFCGHCLIDCGADAHAHVSSAHGSYYGTIDQFRREFGVIAVGHIRNYLQGLNARIRPLVEAELPRIISGNPYYVRADQLMQAAQAGGARDALPIVGTFLEVLSCAGYIWDRFTKANSEADSLDKLLVELEGRVQAVNQLLFPHAGSDASAFSWIHAVVWKLSRTPGLVDKNSIQTAVSTICRTYPNPLNLLGEFDQTCRSHASEVLTELHGYTEAQLLRAPFDEALRRKILATNRTIFDCNTQLWAHLKANYDTYQVLNFLGERASSITQETTTRTLRITKFLHELQQAARKKNITRAFASTDDSFYQFIKDYGEPLTRSIKVFERDFKEAFSMVTNWQCKDNIQTIYGHMLNGIPKDIKLECFLPQQRGVGILAMTLWGGRNGDAPGAWAGLPLVQNSLHHIIHGLDAREVAGSPYFLTEKDVIAVDTDDITHLINELFVVPGFQPRLSQDLPIAEQLCKYGAPRLAMLPCVAPELPEYAYGLEGISDLFAKVQARLLREPNPNGADGGRCFTTLPSSLAGSVKALIQRVPHAADLIFSFCAAILVQQSGDDCVLGKEVLDIRIMMPLTDEQQQGQQTIGELPTAAKSFHVDHIPAMMGLCWNSKGIHETASSVVEDQNEAASIQATLQRIVDEPRYHCQIPAILASLRTAGFSLFATEISDVFGATPLLYYLTTISIPLIDDDDELAEEPLFQTQAKHFRHILLEAERILGPHELASPVLDETCIIPFSAVRQFLGSHIFNKDEDTNKNNVESNKKNNNNNNNNNVAPNQPARPQQQQRGHISVSTPSQLNNLEL